MQEWATCIDATLFFPIFCCDEIFLGIEGSKTSPKYYKSVALDFGDFKHISLWTLLLDGGNFCFFAWNCHTTKWILNSGFTAQIKSHWKIWFSLWVQHDFTLISYINTKYCQISQPPPNLKCKNRGAYIWKWPSKTKANKAKVQVR